VVAQEKVANFQRSLWAYIESNYSTTAKYFYGLNINETQSLTEWVEFEWGSSTRRFQRIAAGAGNLVSPIVSAYVYVKPTDDITRIAVIRDAVVDVLHRPVVPVLDWMGNKAPIGSLWGEEIVVDNYLGLENDVNQWMLSFRFSYQEEMARYR
jgi:hypothetical protein